MATNTPPSHRLHRKTDTEQYGKSTGGEDSLTRLRTDVADEMVDEILQCSLKDFLGHYAPWQVPADIVESVHKHYVEEDTRNPPLVKPIEQDHEATAPQGFVFADFELEPTKIRIHEADVFKPLKEIVDSLLDEEVKGKLHKLGREATLSYVDCPCKTTTSEIRGTNVRFDAYLTESGCPNANTVDLADVAVVAEFKKHLEDRSQNRRQLIADVSQILNNDPRRTWMYAFTIENTMLSVWYFSRSHTAVSVPFDFTTDIKSFIHVFLSLIYATREEIGYDPTVHRVLVGDKIWYVYEIESEGTKRYFRTMETLFTSRVLCITGRKTRVWKAVEVEGCEKGKYEKEMNEGRAVALKDCWLDEGSKTEKAILCDIFERLENAKLDPTILNWADQPHRQSLQGLLDTGDYKEYFMGIDTEMQLSTTKSRLASATPVPDYLAPSRSSSTNAGSEQSTQTTHSQMDMVPVRPRAGQNRLKSPIAREYRTKRHYRLIYEEVGQPLYAATNLRSTFYALYDILIALTLLYLAGYVHRDVSTGNIIMIEKSNATRGKLSDLEYAKVFQDGEPSPDPKTGTLFFMAYEIHAGEALYIPYTPFDPALSLTSLSDHPEPLVSIPSQTRPKHRFSHDLESLLWVALYFLVKYLLQDEQSQIFRQIYNTSTIPSKLRGSLIKMEMGQFRSFLGAHLKPGVAGLTKHLALYQGVLRSSYLDPTNVDDIFDRKNYGLVYKETLRAFSDIKTVLESGDIPNFEFASTARVQRQSLQEESQRKRPRTQEEHDANGYVPDDQDTEPEEQPMRKQPKRGKRMDSRQLHNIVS